MQESQFPYNPIHDIEPWKHTILELEGKLRCKLKFKTRKNIYMCIYMDFQMQFEWFEQQGLQYLRSCLPIRKPKGKSIIDLFLSTSWLVPEDCLVMDLDIWGDARWYIGRYSIRNQICQSYLILTHSLVKTEDSQVTTNSHLVLDLLFCKSLYAIS